MKILIVIVLRDGGVVSDPDSAFYNWTLVSLLYIYYILYISEERQLAADL